MNLPSVLIGNRNLIAVTIIAVPRAATFSKLACNAHRWRPFKLLSPAPLGCFTFKISTGGTITSRSGELAEGSPEYLSSRGRWPRSISI